MRHFRLTNGITAILVLIGLSAVPRAGFANAAQTYFEGTFPAAPFLSKYVDILHERILIIPDSGFRSARFRVEYTVLSDRSGPSIPMVFFALEYAQGFRFLFDDVELSTVPLPLHAVLTDTTLSEIAGNFYVRQFTIPAGHSDTVPKVFIDHVLRKDLRFFRVDFTPGTHTIVFEYDATPFRNIATPTETRELRYALSPASTWRSFGKLDVELDLSQAGEGEVTTNLGDPIASSSPTRWKWEFSALPADEIRIERRHPLGSIANVLIAITPQGLAIISLVLLAWGHAVTLRAHRRRKPKGFSWVLVLGALLVPLLALLVNTGGHVLIQLAIGPHAARSYGAYSFLALIFYPVLMPVYFALAWLWDLRCKRSMGSASFTTP